MEIKLRVKQAGNVNRIIWLLTVALISSIYIFTNESFRAYVLLAFSAAILAVYIVENHLVFTFRLERMHWHIIIFALFCLLSAIWAWKPSAAVSKAVTLFEILICVSILYLAYQGVDDLWCLANAIRFSGFIVAIYSFCFYGMNTIRNVLNAGQRLESEYANINAIAMLSSICIIITFYELLFRGFNLAYLVLCVPCIILIAATVSRKAFIEVGLGIALVIVFRYASRNFFKTLLQIAAIGAALGLVVWVLYSQGLLGGIMKRMQGVISMITGVGRVDNSLSERTRFVQIGLQQFFQSPIFGIGIDSSSQLLVSMGERETYLHNNFVELLCCGGIVGFVIYYSMGLDCIYQYIRYRLQDPMSKLCMILLLDYLIMDYGEVSYYSKITYILFLLFFLEVRKLQQTDPVRTRCKNKADDPSDEAETMAEKVNLEMVKHK